MADYFIRSRPASTWTASTVFVLGDRRRSTGAVPALGIHFEVTTAGTSGGTEPAWNTTVGGTTTDNTVTWTTRGSANTWVASTAYVVGDRVVATTAATALRQARVFECTTAGTSGGTEPAWNTTVGGTQTDNTVTWTVRSPTTWDNAHLRAHGFISSAAIIVSGDTVFFSKTHVEPVVATATTWVLASVSFATPVRFLCVDDTGDPASPTMLATTAVIELQNTHTLSGGGYLFGLDFRTGTGASVHNFTCGDTEDLTWLENCKLRLVSTSASARMNLGNTAGSIVVLKNTTVQFGATGQSIAVDTGKFVWFDTSSALVGATVPTTLFTSGSAFQIEVSGVDLSAFTGALITGSSQRGEAIFNGVSLNASGTLTTGSFARAGGISAHGTYFGSGTDPLNFERKAGNGTWTEELTLIRTGGANDGTAGFSWRCVTESTAQRAYPSYSPWLQTYNTSTGTAKTVTVEILHDSVTNLKDTDIWVEVEALSVTSSLQTDYHNDFGGLLVAGTDQSTSAAVWTTTGMANPNKQKLEVTFTPRIRGPIRARVVVALASKTVFIDPKIAIA